MTLDDEIGRAYDALIRAQRQRDEARAEVARLRGVLDSILDVQAGRSCRGE
jgi:hypothetical protein